MSSCAVASFARQPNGGLILTASAGAAARRDVLITLAARHKLPAVYANPYYVVGGGLLGYGPNIVAQYRQAAGSAIMTVALLAAAAVL